MTAAIFIIMPFVLQGLAMAFDEGYFHRRRGLPRWERIGHPLDTLTVLAAFSWILFTAPSSKGAMVFAALATFSCFFVTKDEWVHSEYCSPGEQWLHGVLFLLHPLIFVAAALIWPALHLPASHLIERASDLTWLSSLSASLGLGVFEARFFFGQFLLVLLVLVYQTVYWNFLWKPRALPIS